MERNGNHSPQPHQLIMQERKRLELAGVIDVDGFDEQTISVSTSQGVLTIRGQNLHVRQLSLESGNVSIEGNVDSLAYREASKAGFFGRLFR